MQDEIWHVVKQGDWLSKIASQYGLSDWHVIWNDAHNATLAQHRDPNILFPGDQIFIPQPALREEARNTDKCHEHELKTFSDFFELTLRFSDGTPIKNENYTLYITDPPLTDKTDASGHLKHEHLDPTKMQSGILDLPGVFMQLWIDLGALNPAHKDNGSEGSRYDNGLSGIQMRLANLGYDPGSLEGRQTDSGELPEETQCAIALFQINEMNLPDDKITGKLDSDTRKAIVAKAGA